MTNLECIKHFYNCFAKADIEGMLSCYHEHIEFEDPAFGKLYGLDAVSYTHLTLPTSDLV